MTGPEPERSQYLWFAMALAALALIAYVTTGYG